jgi:signal peptidase I
VRKELVSPMAQNQSTRVVRPAQQRQDGGVVEIIKTILSALIIVVGVRTVAFEAFNIPSGSMIPTLLVGDYLFVSKYAYGYSRYSLMGGLPLFEGRILAHEPKRGDVVVFKWPHDNETAYIKRVIGLPGDRIELRAGRLYINGDLVDRKPIQGPGGRLIDPNTRRMAQQYIETLPGGKQHIIQEFSDEDPLDNFPAYTVPAGNYFMMGDNRDNSSDSRVPVDHGGVGPVPFENLIGRAEVLFFSLDGDAAIWEIWKWPTHLRFGRLLNGVN